MAMPAKEARKEFEKAALQEIEEERKQAEEAAAAATDPETRKKFEAQPQKAKEQALAFAEEQKEQAKQLHDQAMKTLEEAQAAAAKALQKLEEARKAAEEAAAAAQDPETHKKFEEQAKQALEQGKAIAAERGAQASAAVSALGDAAKDVAAKAKGKKVEDFSVRVPLGTRVKVHIEKLLDVPRAYHYISLFNSSYEPESYRVKVFDEDSQELACSDVIDGFPGCTPCTDDIESIDVEPSKGVLSVNTTKSNLAVQVEYSGGEFIGFCHLHRMDPRSEDSHPYMLSNMEWQTVNCGIRLRLEEVDGVELACDI